MKPDLSDIKKETQRGLIPRGRGMGEGCHFYKIDGRYYIISANYAPTGRMQAARADHVHGPYETAVIAAKETFGTQRGWLLNPIGLGMKVPEPGATFRLTEPGGRIGHAELKLGPGTLMLAEEFPECGFRAPQDADGRSVTIHLHVADADAMAAQACAAGATMLRKPTDEFYGERSCLLRDPFGHSWMLGHQIEEVTPAEMQRRYDAMFKRG